MYKDEYSSKLPASLSCWWLFYDRFSSTYVSIAEFFFNAFTHVLGGVLSFLYGHQTVSFIKSHSGNAAVYDH